MEHDIIKEVKKLNFSQGEYIVVGTAILGVLGLKDVHDIDIVVSPDLFETLKGNGWTAVPYTYKDKPGQIYLKEKDIEIYLDVNCGNFNPTLEELLSRKQTVEGINFLSLEDLINFKKEYQRPKDANDIALIREYFAKQI